jgi:Zn-dependent alcohol dehydrogenase
MRMRAIITFGEERPLKEVELDLEGPKAGEVRTSRRAATSAANKGFDSMHEGASIGSVVIY